MEVESAKRLLGESLAALKDGNATTSLAAANRALTALASPEARDRPSSAALLARAFHRKAAALGALGDSVEAVRVYRSGLAACGGAAPALAAALRLTLENLPASWHAAYWCGRIEAGQGPAPFSSRDGRRLAGIPPDARLAPGELRAALERVLATRRDVADEAADLLCQTWSRGCLSCSALCLPPPARLPQAHPLPGCTSRQHSTTTSHTSTAIFPLQAASSPGGRSCRTCAAPPTSRPATPARPCETHAVPSCSAPAPARPPRSGPRRPTPGTRGRRGGARRRPGSPPRVPPSGRRRWACWAPPTRRRATTSGRCCWPAWPRRGRAATSARGATRGRGGLAPRCPPSSAARPRGPCAAALRRARTAGAWNQGSKKKACTRRHGAASCAASPRSAWPPCGRAGAPACWRCCPRRTRRPSRRCCAGAPSTTTTTSG
uniref:Uncharacterized protein n=1 Tax=Auxenochlorella protothecoides TaxID=3075 RepID=A0A1D2A4D2_AUXPR